MKTFFVLSLVLAPAVGLAAQTATKYRGPRTSEGQPDLQGVWNFSSSVPLERPSTFAGRTVATKEEIAAHAKALDAALRMVATFAPVEAIGVLDLDHVSRVDDLRTSLITYPENGRMPPLQEGATAVPTTEQVLEALSQAKNGPPPALAQFFAPRTLDSYQNFSPAERCIVGAPSAPFQPDLDNNFVQIIQSRNAVALLSDTDRRIAPLDGRAPLPGTFRTWSGDARARWDGDTLVVETRNFNNRTRSFEGAGLSREKVVTERFTRRGPALLDYEATVVDPKTFTDKVTIAFPMALVDSRVYENACHEHNYSLANALSAVRKAERDAAQAK